MSVSDILKVKNQEVYTCRKECPVMDCIRLMNQKRIGAIVVTDQSLRVEGIVTERDVLHMIDVNNGTPGDTTVADIMTPKAKLITTRKDVTIEKVMETMTDNRIRHMPVVEDGRLIGIISIGDAVKWSQEKALVENESMKNYITGV